MPADGDRSSEADDLKAKFKEALAKKQGNESGAIDKGHGPEPKVHDTHGPEGGKRGFIRRKTG